MACDDDDSHASTDLTDADNALAKRLKIELDRVQGKLKLLEKENEDLRQQVSSLKKNLQILRKQLPQEAPLEAETTCKAAMVISRFQCAPVVLEEEGSLNLCPVNPVDQFVFDSGLGVYINRHSGLMFDGTVYFYFDKKSGQHLYYNNETRCYEKLKNTQRQSIIADANASSEHLCTTASPKTAVLENGSSAETEEGEITECDEDEPIASDVQASEAVIPLTAFAKTANLRKRIADIFDADHELKKDLVRPSMRLLVTETPLPIQTKANDDLFEMCRAGVVFFVPADALTRIFGRNASPVANCTLDIPLDSDDSVLPHHASVHFDEQVWKFILTDKHACGSNHVKTSCVSRADATNPQDDTDIDEEPEFAIENEKQYIVAHNDTICIGRTRMLVHIHFGHEDCDECQPANAFRKYAQTLPGSSCAVDENTLDGVGSFRPTITDVKRKYGLRRKDYTAARAGSDAVVVDRARMRRAEHKDSDLSCNLAASVPSSLCTPISAENKGCAMLLKMGWKLGDSLGSAANDTLTDCDKFSSSNSRRSRLLEPLPLLLRPLETAGLGFVGSLNLSSSYGISSTNSSADGNGVEKYRRHVKMRQRYEHVDKQLSVPSVGSTPAQLREANGSSNTILSNTAGIVLSRPPMVNWMKGGLVSNAM